MLPKVVLISLRWHLLAAIVPRLFLLGFTFAQPFLISATLRYINESESRSTKDYAYGLIAATLLIYVGIAVSLLDFEPYSLLKPRYRSPQCCSNNVLLV